MPPKSDKDGKRTVQVASSRVISRPDALEGGEETEITAQIYVPQDGGWGWVVVLAAFWSIFILDGVVFTFGSIKNDMAKDLNTSGALIALINSISLSLYLASGPLVSAFINRFGFRACIMTGSALSSFSLFTSYFAPNYGTLCLFYGVFAGFGYALINLSTGLIVGFYFEKLRSVALAISSCGSSVGVMTMYPVNTFLVNLGGWRPTTLFHSGLMGITFFLGMTFRPVVSLAVTQTVEVSQPTRTVTYLPSLANVPSRMTRAQTKSGILQASPTERLFSAVSNANFPTAAAVVELDESTESAAGTSQPGPSTSPASKLTITAVKPQGGFSKRQLEQVKSIISTGADKKVEISIPEEDQKKKKLMERIFQWEPHNPESRPLYRDDAFYEGKIEKLPVYQKSMIDTDKDAKTGLEYSLAVSRAATTHDLRERRGVFTTAVRRVLATMMDPHLLKKTTFKLLCCSGFSVYLGFLVPYLYIYDRNKYAGVDEKHCGFFVSAIGFSNAIGRVVLGTLAYKLDPFTLYCFFLILTGVSTICSILSYGVIFQYAYCSIFGFSIACLSTLRSLVLVNLYGLDKLTNAMGMMLLFQGIGSLISTPLASILKETFGFQVSFIMSGIFVTFSGVILIPIKRISRNEVQAVSPPMTLNKDGQKSSKN